jgi:predicted metalloprotease with PDZ domain
MKQRRPPYFALTLSILLLCAAVGDGHGQAATAAPAPPVKYELRFDKPNSHLLDITMHAAGLRGPAVEFAMPAWAPGSYGINDYAKMVEQFSAAAPDGQPLPWRKTDKQTWRIELGRAREVIVRYKLYGNTLSNHWVQYNSQHAFISGPAAWMYLVGGKERPVVLTIDVPAGWKVATGMRSTAPNTYAAADYDWLIDSPIEISDFALQSFTHAGATYHVVVHDVINKADFSKVTRDIEKIVAATVPWFAGVEPGGRAVPFEDYWFLFHIWPRTGGGLEHLNSTQINYSTPWDAEGFAGRFGTDYQLKMFVISHEFYHAWNVKRLRPRPLGPFDYAREVHTPSLWISEGLTSYYGQLALVRAGLVKPQEYLDSIASLLTEFESLPGRKERSIEDASWDTWFTSRPPGDTNLQNTNYSYYDGGQIVGHVLDFAIRHATGNQKSLDDWMRLLYRRHALPRPGFLPEEAVRAASEVAGRDMSDLFRRYISRKEVPDYPAYFAHAGIEVQKTPQSGRAWLGVALSADSNGNTLVTNVLPGGPALEAGLDRDDVITEADGKPVKFDQFMRALAAKKPGERIQLKVWHLREVRTVEVTLGADPTFTYALKPMASPSAEQKLIYESWLGIP